EAGADVKEDDPLGEIETDKAAVTIPSPRAGRVVEVSGAVGDAVLVGQVIVVIDDGSGEAREVARTREVAETIEVAETSSAAAPSVTTPVAHQGPVPAAPATRRMARELGVDINAVQGSGPGGRVTVEDVKRFSEGVTVAPAAAGPEHVPAEQLGEDPAAIAEYAAHAASTIPFLDIEPMPDFEKWGPVRRKKLRSIRRKVARKMVTSMILAPHVAHMDEADVTDLEAFRKKERERRVDQAGGRLTLLAFVVKAITAGLKKAPSFNASLDPFVQEIVYKDYFNIGVAVDTGHGLVVPVIRGTDSMSIV
ncbi:MAG: hypothetical protein GXP54_06525, partial [Deltaproteobacteria bacterium]|nr:hypothetical protein [Deltaproteobacteria bacterium]